MSAGTQGQHRGRQAGLEPAERLSRKLPSEGAWGAVVGPPGIVVYKLCGFYTPTGPGQSQASPRLAVCFVQLSLTFLNLGFLICKWVE